MNPWALKQSLIFLVFLGVAVGMSWIKESTIKSAAFPDLRRRALMLILVEMLGFVGKGAQRWLDVGPVRLQPSEFMKPVIVLVLARFYELLPPADIRRWRAIWPAALLVGIPVMLVLWQPDMGTALMVLFIGATVMFSPACLVAVRGRAQLSRSLLRSPMRSCTNISEAGADLPRSGKRPARPAITSPSRRSRSGRAVCSAKAISRAARATSTICPKAIPTSYFPPWSRNGDLPAGLLILAFAMVIRWGMKVSIRARKPASPSCRGRAFGDDLLLRGDQPDDGDGPGAGCRRPAAARQLRRIGGDDGNAVHRSADGA
jgi:rod shape determining protein RodA